MPNEIRAHTFDVQELIRLLTSAANIVQSADESAEPVYQIDYLARYCQRLGVVTVVSESHYVDRHFLDEFALYYARNLRPPPNTVQRFHMFKRSFSDDGLTDLMDHRAALTGKPGADFDTDLSHDYLGFVSIRPVPGAPVGRTVLRRLEDDDHRDIWATGPHTAHLANLRLSVEGIPFQQQDEAVGACATAALWTALNRVSRRDGIRAPTPAEVSEAASRHLLTTGRTLPAIGGFTMEQLAEAVRQKGLAPEYVGTDPPERFAAALHTYLRSGIPVVLELRLLVDVAEQGGPERISFGGKHAVTAVGFQTGDTSDPVLEGTLPFSSAFMRKLYLHDDRLGPYARAFVRPTRRRPLSDDSDADEFLPECILLEVETKREGDDRDEPNKDGLETWLVESALAPVYPKLRLPVRSLIQLGERLGRDVEHIVGNRAKDLRVDLYYERCGEYVQSLNGMVASKASAFFRQLVFPRWCAIVRWSLEGQAVADFVFDTTDILREGELPSDAPQRTLDGGSKLLLAVVSFQQGYRDELLKLAERLGVAGV